MDDTMPQDMDTPPVGGGSFDTQQGFQEPQPEEVEGFTADFDAGVEASEEDDPKKFIQQLTGKLSQSLRKYNQNLPKPDAELSKYVAGMVLKQALEGLPQQDVSDIMDKAQTDGEEEDMQQDAMQAQPEQPQPQAQQEEMPPMNETTASTINPTKTVNTKAPTKMRKGGYNRKPYRATV